MEAKGGILSTKPTPGPMLQAFGMRVQNRTLKKFLFFSSKSSNIPLIYTTAFNSACIPLALKPYIAELLM